MKILFAAFMLMLFTAGCCWFLPSGDPPPGNIVNNQPSARKKFTKPSEAFDYMVSSITTILLEKCPGEELSVSVNNTKCRDITAAVLRESSKISGNRFSGSKRSWELKSVLDGENLCLALYHNGIRVWEEIIYSPF